MLRTLPYNRTWATPYRIALIALFAVLTILSAKISVEIGPVPVTLQVLVVLLSGFVLGARDGALSQLSYVLLIALGFPFDARGLGTAAFAGPTAGFLIGFIAAAFVAGWLVEHSQDRWWQRWVAGIAAIVTLYAFGLFWFQSLPVNLILTDQPANELVGLERAWAWGVAPFIGIDILKALVAAALTEGLRRFLLAQYPKQ